MCGVRAGVDPGGMRAPWVGVVGCVRLEPFPSLSVGVVPESILRSVSVGHFPCVESDFLKFLFKLVTALSRDLYWIIFRCS